MKLLEKEPEVAVTVDPEKIDKLISLLHEADPTGEKPDSEELLSLEGEFPSDFFPDLFLLILTAYILTEQVSLMAPLIDEELQKVDRTIATLNAVNSQLVEAMNLYHMLMKESVQLPPGTASFYAAGLSFQPQYQPQMMQQPPPPHGYMGQAVSAGMGMPVTSNMPVYQSPQHMQQQQQYPPPQLQQQQHPSHLPPPYTPSQMSAIPSNQQSTASPMHQHHQQHMGTGQQQHVSQQPQQQQEPEYMYQQHPPVSSYPASYQQQQ